MIELVGDVLKEEDISVDECRSKTFATTARCTGSKYCRYLALLARLNHSGLWQPGRLKRHERFKVSFLPPIPW